MPTYTLKPRHIITMVDGNGHTMHGIGSGEGDVVGTDKDTDSYLTRL
jgi:hypothetical protein